MDPISIALGLAQFAPSLMRFFGVGEKPAEVAEKVIGIARQVTGASTPEEALQSIREKQGHAHEFQMAVLAANADLERAYLADTQSARNMQIAAIGSEDPYVRRFVYHLAAGCLLFSGVYIFWITFGHVPPENVRVVDTVLGFLLGTVITLVLQFFFGSSQGSVKASQMLRDIARKVTG